MAEMSDDYPAFLQDEVWSICDDSLVACEVKAAWYREPDAAPDSVRIVLRCTDDQFNKAKFFNMIDDIDGWLRTQGLQRHESLCRTSEDPLDRKPVVTWVVFPTGYRPRR